MHHIQSSGRLNRIMHVLDDEVHRGRESTKQQTEGEQDTRKERRHH